MDFSVVYPKHLVLDRQTDWPKSLKDIMSDQESGVVAYLKEECRIDKDAEEDVMLRIMRPENPYNSTWIETKERVLEHLGLFSIVGFHCTRLTDREVANVRQEGLKPLCPEYTLRRIRALVDEGLMTQSTADELSRANDTTETNRAGNVCFFHCVNTLQCEGTIGRLLRRWGGEGALVKRCVKRIRRPVFPIV